MWKRDAIVNFTGVVMSSVKHAPLLWIYIPANDKLYTTLQQLDKYSLSDREQAIIFLQYKNLSEKKCSLI